MLRVTASGTLSRERVRDTRAHPRRLGLGSHAGWVEGGRVAYRTCGREENGGLGVEIGLGRGREDGVAEGVAVLMVDGGWWMGQ